MTVPVERIGGISPRGTVWRNFMNLLGKILKTCRWQPGLGDVLLFLSLPLIHCATLDKSCCLSFLIVFLHFVFFFFFFFLPVQAICPLRMSLTICIYSAHCSRALILLIPSKHKWNPIMQRKIYRLLNAAIAWYLEEAFSHRKNRVHWDEKMPWENWEDASIMCILTPREGPGFLSFCLASSR